MRKGGLGGIGMERRVKEEGEVYMYIRRDDSLTNCIIAHVTT